MENKQSIKWQALEFKYSKKSSDWFWSLWIISLGTIVASVIFDNILFAILIFMMAFTVSLQATRKPKLENFEINEKGIVTKYKKYDFKTLESYWIKNDDFFPRIILKSKSLTSPLLTIPLGEKGQKDIEEFISNYLKEEELSEPVPYIFTKYF